MPCLVYESSFVLSSDARPSHNSALSLKEGSGWKPTLKPRNSWSGAAEHSQCQTLLRSFFALEKLEKPDLTIFLSQLSVLNVFSKEKEWKDLEQNSFQRRCVVQSINFPTIELKQKQSLCISTRLKYCSVYFSFSGVLVKYPIIMIWWLWWCLSSGFSCSDSGSDTEVHLLISWVRISLHPPPTHPMTSWRRCICQPPLLTTMCVSECREIGRFLKYKQRHGGYLTFCLKQKEIPTKNFFDGKCDRKCEHEQQAFFGWSQCSHFCLVSSPKI